MPNLLNKLEALLPEEETRNNPEGNEERKIGYNEYRYKTIAKLPAMLEMIKGEVEKLDLTTVVQASYLGLTEEEEMFAYNKALDDLLDLLK
jgi:hypothetical protein